MKARDFQPCEPFIIQGRPSINDTGYFELTNPPGFAGTLSDNKPLGDSDALFSAVSAIGRPQSPESEDKKLRAQELQERGKSYQELQTRWVWRNPRWILARESEAGIGKKKAPSRS